MKILITGGAGFVGSALANYFRNLSALNEIIIFDNLHRRGSEWNLETFSKNNVEFVHGDVRNPQDLDALHGNFDLLIEASAEPSVNAGITSSPRYVLDTNLVGAINCLEFARLRCAGFIFLSSSRIFSISNLTGLPLIERPTRFDFDEQSPVIAGVSGLGITESFACNGPRSYYGSSKLAAELLVQEFAANTNLSVIINRCGVIAGPGQFGSTDQGIFTLWLASHFFRRSLMYTGFPEFDTKSHFLQFCLIRCQ